VTAKRYDLSVGKFNVIADVTEATATRRDKTVRTMMALAQAAATVQDLETAQAALARRGREHGRRRRRQLPEVRAQEGAGDRPRQPTPEEQQAAQDANSSPIRPAIAQLAQAKALNAQANKFDSGAKLDEAKTVLTLAQAKKTNHEATKPHILGKLTTISTPRLDIQERRGVTEQFTPTRGGYLWRTAKTKTSSSN
jgi:hypothetical protein